MDISGCRTAQQKYIGNVKTSPHGTVNLRHTASFP